MNPRILNSGMAEALLPLEIADKKDLEYKVHKKKWSFSGIAGVITYQWKASGQKYSLALMFHSLMIKSNKYLECCDQLRGYCRSEPKCLQEFAEGERRQPDGKRRQQLHYQRIWSLYCPGSHVLFKNRQDQPHCQVYRTSSLVM